MNFHFIYLAAGYSRRFGANKLLASYEGTPMYRVLFDRLVNVLKTYDAARDITVVTQYREIEAEVRRIGEETVKSVRCVINPDPSRGISSSIKCGVADLLSRSRELALFENGKCDFRENSADEALVFFVADTPNLSEETVTEFLHAFARSGKRLGCIGRDGEMGNPGGFCAEFIPELMELEGDRGGKRILLAHSDEVFIFSDTEPEELEDIDYSC